MTLIFQTKQKDLLYGFYLNVTHWACMCDSFF